MRAAASTGATAWSTSRSSGARTAPTACTARCAERTAAELAATLTSHRQPKACCRLPRDTQPACSGADLLHGHHSYEMRIPPWPAQSGGSVSSAIAWMMI